MVIPRAILLWLLILALPVQGWASATMMHCMDGRQGHSAVAKPDAPRGHDHAAMMRAVSNAAPATESPQGHDHHAMMMAMQGQSDTSDHASHAPSDLKAKMMGECQCGCDCSDNCARSCITSALMAAAIPASAPALTGADFSRQVNSRALAAHRLTPLRPPSAAAI